MSNNNEQLINVTVAAGHRTTNKTALLKLSVGRKGEMIKFASSDASFTIPASVTEMSDGDKKFTKDENGHLQEIRRADDIVVIAAHITPDNGGQAVPATFGTYLEDLVNLPT